LTDKKRIFAESGQQAESFGSIRFKEVSGHESGHCCTDRKEE